ncbi:reverse transcriptase domain-containing protein [Pseudonocardia sp. DR1-2]|uniref:reverse transcriptase domain-containing protein n=1 Tax=Pseudonocardia sp. DR1-2 TaxID=2951168 RepID=UPI0020448A38|nr:reverse transcriptase domain-containing protein [Pseudonocardia sp. DR1-2]MCM3849581.1 reverse transcriptase domain-containing protein [Pseudonocardia sp. DR1-2]
MVKLSKQVVDSVPMESSADSLTRGADVHRFPPLVIYHCLRDGQQELIDATKSAYRQGRHVQTETLTAPRRGFGPRPVSISAPIDRLMYNALVQLVAEDIPDTVRTEETWKKYESVSGELVDGGGRGYLVEFDIASCYEYIEHVDLREELVLRSLKVSESLALEEVLGALAGRSRGLPQLSAMSDRLADVYLSIMERELLRSGVDVARYADDFRAVAPSWGVANQTIEIAAEAARRLGLVLSTEKTTILRESTVGQQRADMRDFLNRMIGDGDVDNDDFPWLDRYGEESDEEEESESDDSDGRDSDSDDEEKGKNDLEGLAWSILREWSSKEIESSQRALAGSFVGFAINTLRNATDRIPDDILSDSVFSSPLSLELVCRYLWVRSHETHQNWTTLRELTEMQRQSPWAKIWLLHAVRTLSESSGEDFDEVRSWTLEQLKDRHEVVRCLASWALANRNGGDVLETLPELYGLASSLTRPALAAAAGRGGVDKSNATVRAIIADSRLSKVAYEWGQRGRGQ